jgi:hypothetical protein
MKIGSAFSTDFHPKRFLDGRYEKISNEKQEIYNPLSVIPTWYNLIAGPVPSFKILFNW